MDIYVNIYNIYIYISKTLSIENSFLEKPKGMGQTDPATLS